MPGSGFGTGLANLVAALNTDFDWLREHTRYLQRAIEWDKGGRPANRLLSGNDILEAKAWAARRPKECARAHGPAPRLHPRERRGGGGAIERAAQAARSDGRSTSRARDGPARTRRGAEAGRGCAAQTGEDQKYCVVVVSILGRVRRVAGWLANQQRITAERRRIKQKSKENKQITYFHAPRPSL